MKNLIKRSYDLYINIWDEKITVTDAEKEIKEVSLLLKEDYLGQAFMTKKNLYKCKLALYIKYNECLFYELLFKDKTIKLFELTDWFRPLEVNEFNHYEYYFDIQEFKEVYKNRDKQMNLLIDDYEYYSYKIAMIDKDLYSDDYMEILKFGCIVEEYLYKDRG